VRQAPVHEASKPSSRRGIPLPVLARRDQGWRTRRSRKPQSRSSHAAGSPTSDPSARGGEGRAQRDQTGRHFPLSTLAKTGDDRNSLMREPVGPFSMTGLTRWTQRRPRGPTPRKYQQAHHRACPRHPRRGPRAHRSRCGGCRSRASTCEVTSPIRRVDVDSWDEPGHDVAGFCLAIHAFQTRAFGRPSAPQRQP
jgi:hypothetical protein